MNVKLPAQGRYVVAVSGGVDSVALLDYLCQQTGYELIVAHFDHGIREDSKQDRLLVQALAERYGLPFAYEEGSLGPGTSEAVARDARYSFLRFVMRKQTANAIITAHHQDDVLETAVINMIRGTGRKGLTALKNQADIERPLLDVSKHEIRAYAERNKLSWREDSTNEDESYLRNYVRRRVLPRLDNEARSHLLQLISGMHTTNNELDTLLVKHLQEETSADVLNRQWFNQLPHEVAKEMLAGWLRQHEIRSFDRKTLERLVVAAKVSKAGSTFDVINGYTINVSKDKLALGKPER